MEIKNKRCSRNVLIATTLIFVSSYGYSGENTTATNMAENSDVGYSSSPSGVNLAHKKPAAANVMVDSGTITFSEFSLGTAITDQYADKGIVFGGDTPFITSDGSNPTSPVLTGSPRFNGAIEGYFVDPQDPTQVLTVSSFSLSAGYFDNLSSTALSWYNEEGELLGKRFDSVFGIEDFNVTGDNIAHFRIAIETEEMAGFAIDNVSFNQAQSAFDFEFETDKVYHQAGSGKSNSFSVYFRDLKSKSGADLAEICSKHTFTIKDTSQTLTGSCTVKADNKAFKTDFTINNSPYNLVDAKMSICLLDECKEIEDLKNLNVYGTSFDVSQHGYSFKNGGWSDSMLVEGSIWCWIIGNCTTEQLSIQGTLLNVALGLQPLLPESRRAEAFEIIGKFDGLDTTIPSQRNFGGVCYGLATSAASNFNNRQQSSAWGSSVVENSTAADITTLYQEHWINKATDSPKPLPQDVHGYDAAVKTDIVQSLAQIAYHFVTQEAYSGKGATSGVGSASFDKFANLRNFTDHYVSHFDSDKVSPVVFFFRKQGGHAIIASQLISYNDKTVLLTHDNNFVDKYGHLEFDNNQFSTDQINFIVDYKSTGTAQNGYGDYYAYGPYFKGSGAMHSFSKIDNDELTIHGAKSVVEQVNRSPSKRVEKRQVGSVHLDSFEHLKVVLQGAKVVSVIDKSNQEPVALLPVIGKFSADVSYFSRSLMSTNVYLPVNGNYEIKIERFDQFPVLNLFMHKLNAPNSVQVVNYEQVDNSSTQFTVNVNDSVGIEVIKENGDTVVASHSEVLALYINPVTHLTAVANSGSVELAWELQNQQTIDKVVVVRNLNNPPTDMDDGSIKCNAVGNACIDNSIYNENTYYYGVFVVSLDGQVSEVEHVSVNTHQAGIVGILNDSEGEPAANVEVSLYSGEGLQGKLFDTGLSDDNGRYAFNGLPLGKYKLIFSGGEYVQTEVLTEVLMQYHEVITSISAIPGLLISAAQSAETGSELIISWNSIHATDANKVNLKVLENGTSRTLAENIDINTGHYVWVVDSSAQTVQLVVELVSDVTVNAQAALVVLQGNRAPILSNVIPDQSAQESVSFSFTFAENTFTDEDAGDMLSYSATKMDGGALPSWLTFDMAARTFTGTPANGDVGSLDIKVMATDGHVTQASFDEFSITVSAAPVVTPPSGGESSSGGGSMGILSILVILMLVVRRQAKV